MEEGKELRYCCYVINSIRSSFEWIFQWFHRFISQDRRSSMLLGFFLQPHIAVCSDPSGHGLKSPPHAQFLCTSDEGKDLKEGKWGALDASLRFVGQSVYIVGSSNGFLLCSTELRPQMHYCVCNPVTKEWRVLPKPLKVYKYVALAFICEGNNTSLSGVHYRVVRAGVSNPRELTTKLELETFSSVTGEWKESILICASPFTLVVANLPAFVVDKVIYWKDLRCRMLAYNPTMEFVELMELPGDAQNFVYWSDLLGQSEGKIHYARHDKCYLEIWILQAQWVMIHKLSLATMTTMIAPKTNKFEGLDIIAFHPCDSRLILLTLDEKSLWYNLESREVNLISEYSSCKYLLFDYFLYEWPFVPSVSC